MTNGTSAMKYNVLQFKQNNPMKDILYLFEKSTSNKNTFRNYEKHIRAFFNISEIELISFNQLSNIKIKDVIVYLESISNTSHSNMVQFKASLNKLYKYAYEYSYENDLDLVSFNPFDSQSVKDFIKSKRVKTVSNVKESDLNVIPNDTPNMLINAINSDNASSTRYRDKLIIKTLYYMGIRVEKLINLKVNDLFIRDNRYYIFIKKAKGNKNRPINIDKLFYDELVDYINSNGLSDEDIIFRARGNNPFKSTRAINDIIHKYEDILKQNDTLSTDTHITAHKFRSMAATIRAKNGWTSEQLTNFLGHTNYTTTMGYINVVNQLEDTTNAELFKQLNLQ